MKKYLFMAVAAIAALSSCSSDNDFEQSQTGKQALVFTATMENSEATRATFDNTEKCAAWEAGDQISINGKTYSAQIAGTTTTFKADGEDAPGTTYNAYFPADLYDGTTATLPAIQTYEAGEFNMPMYASSTTTTLAFKNLCAVLAVKVTSADIETLKSIKVASNKVMNGSFTVTDDKAVMGTDGSNAVVLESSSALTLTSEGTTFYIAIPAQEYKYLNIFLSADGETYTQAMATKKAAGLGEIARSKIFNIDYAKNATKLWAGNLFFADCNIGATSPTEGGDYYTWGGSTSKSFSDQNTGTDALSGNTDTAYKLWGSNWRMMTKDELEQLCGFGSWNGNGLLCESADYADNTVFLPAAGYCQYGSVGNTTYGYYWSSTPNSSNSSQAYRLYFGSSSQSIDNYAPRYLGHSVRAVLEEAETPTPPATAPKPLAGKFSVSDTKKVYFSKGNLWADESNVLHFESSQTAFADGYVSTHVSYFPWSDNVANAVGTVTAEEVGTYLFCDENHKISVDGSAQLYYALSQAECEYLASHHQYRFVTVNDVRGCVIAPDGVSLASDKTEYTESELEEDNLVFLPGAGVYTKNGQGEYTIQLKSSGYGRYWSSSVFPSDEIRSYMMNYDSEDLYSESVMAKTNGLCLRLVTDCE